MFIKAAWHLDEAETAIIREQHNLTNIYAISTRPSNRSSINMVLLLF